MYIFIDHCILVYCFHANIVHMLPQVSTLKERTEKFLESLLKNLPKTKADLEKKKKKLHYVESNMLLLERYRDGIEEGRYEPKKILFKLFQKQRTRSISGITAITILLKPWPCQGKCVYCPTEARMPKSYLSGEPAVMRAILNKWDAKRQVKTRLSALEMMGHNTDKNELIILGGTWQNYPLQYREEYIQRMYEGLNGKRASSIEEAQNMNEMTQHRCIGLSLETRPDCVDEKEVKHMRWLGATKIELGVQTVFDDISDITKRGHDMKAVYTATKLLRDAGFKIHYHMMPNLPGSTIEKDEEMFQILFSDERLKPDMLKLYPCVVVNHSELKEWEKEGKYTSYTDEDLIELLIRIKKYIPNYNRIMRLGRDIPAYDITSGNTITNIREEVQKRMKERGLLCNCIRCREVGFRTPPNDKEKMKITQYDANDGKEYFIEFHNPDNNTLFGFTRLRIPSQYFSKEKHFIEELNDCAIIRELHTYGQVVGVGDDDDDATQHKGYGKKLLEEAEKISKEKYGLKKIAVISGIGTRQYYKKLGYTLEGLYMIKKL